MQNSEYKIISTNQLSLPLFEYIIEYLNISNEVMNAIFFLGKFLQKELMSLATRLNDETQMCYETTKLVCKEHQRFLDSLSQNLATFSYNLFNLAVFHIQITSLAERLPLSVCFDIQRNTAKAQYKRKIYYCSYFQILFCRLSLIKFQHIV